MNIFPICNVTGDVNVKFRIISIRKKYVVRTVLICAAAFLAISVVCSYKGHKGIAVNGTSIWQIEPKKPTDIDDPPFSRLPYPSKMVSVGEVIKKGKEIPLQFAYNNPEWKRQAYKKYWHSSYGRWSYVPYRIHYAMHRIFASYPTASVFYDFTHELGIWEESDAFKIPSKAPYENIVLVVMQTKVEKIKTLGNQVVVVGKPAADGLQVLLVPNKDLTPFNPKESIMFQLVTPEGDEIDSTNDIYYVNKSGLAEPTKKAV